jgi:serine/arginine repetitive matrix protein 2
VDLETDTKNSVLAILASGLPFPKSPSIHIEEASQGKAANDQAMEREERGWWALRFQQIMREMQRQAGM